MRWGRPEIAWSTDRLRVPTARQCRRGRSFPHNPPDPICPMNSNLSETEPNELNPFALRSDDPAALMASLTLSLGSGLPSSLPVACLLSCLEAQEDDDFQNVILHTIEYLPAASTPGAIFAALFQSAARRTEAPSALADPADNQNLRVARNSPEAAVLERQFRTIYSAWFSRGAYLEAFVSDPSRTHVFQLGAAVFRDGYGYWPCDSSDNCAFISYLGSRIQDGTAPRHVRSLLRIMDATGYFDLRGKSRTWQVFVYYHLSEIVRGVADLLESEAELTGGPPDDFASAGGDLVAFIWALMESDQFGGVADPVTYELAV